MRTTNAIKRGATLYCFQEQYYFGKYDLEDCIAAVADMGGEGVELIPDQMIAEFPKVSDHFIGQWKEWMDQYGVVPTCMDDFVESALYAHREVSEDELVERFKKAIQLVKRMGFTVIREQFALSEDSKLMTLPLLERCFPYAQEAGISIGLEVHAPNYIQNPQIDGYLEMILKKNSPYLGLIPDFSIFCTDIYKRFDEYYRRHGVREQVIEITHDSYRNDFGKEGNLKRLSGSHLSEIEYEYASTMFNWHKKTEPETMLEFSKYIHHCHAKFQCMTKDYRDEALDMAHIVDVLRKMNYHGCISSEYEGNRWVHDDHVDDCVEQVRRHQILLKNVLGY